MLEKIGFMVMVTMTSAHGAGLHACSLSQMIDMKGWGSEVVIGSLHVAEFVKAD